MFAPVVALIAHLLIALGGTTFTVAYPDESWAQANDARQCVEYLHDAVICTDGDTFGW